jgi:Rrf2 family iron-sulfur cluster assembly transcriptional regulator
MRLTTKGRYAVMAMADLAKNGEERAVSLAEIALRQDISLSYLEQLFARLRRRGLVKSVRGPGGGYRLSKGSGEIAVADIVKAVDEPLEAVRCKTGGGGCMPGGERCLTHDLWDELGRQIDLYLSAVSLRDVLARKLRPAAEARETESSVVAA